MHTRYTGLIAAPFTPFKKDGSLNLDAIPAYAQFLHRRSVSAVFVCGTTGEGASLTSEEREAVAETWVRVAPAGLRIIVHTGHTSLPDARRLAAHAEKIGASAVAEAAPGLPFYYYNIPSMTGVTLPVAGFLAAARERIPTLAGIKYTYEDMPDFQACVHYEGGHFDILFGRDELLLEGWTKGARGAVGSTYNYASPLYARLIKAVERDDLSEARALQDMAIRMIAVCNNVGVTHLAASKAVMAMLGVDCGPVRVPLTNPSANQIASLRAELEAMGFFDFAR